MASMLHHVWLLFTKDLHLILSAEGTESVADRPGLFNGAQHVPSLLPPALVTQIPITVPDMGITVYRLWKDLIVRLRNISQSDVHVVTLTPHYVQALLDASTVAMLTWRISE